MHLHLQSDEPAVQLFTLMIGLLHLMDQILVTLLYHCKRFDNF